MLSRPESTSSTVCFTFIEPWNALAPTNASTARMPSDALKDRWEYRRWYPIVILFNVSEKTRYQMSRAHCAPERCQLPEHNGGDEDDLGHCRWGATVDTISCSQVCTAKKDSVLPPNSRPPLRRTGSHKRAEGGDGRQRADIRGVNLFIRRIAVFSTVCAVVKLCCAVYIPKTALRITIKTWRARQRTDVHAEVAESSATLLTSRTVSPSVIQTFHSFSSPAPMPIPTGR